MKFNLWKKPSWQPPKYISWYKEPRWKYKSEPYQIEYIMKNVEGDWDYTFDKSQAFQFDTEAEAIQVTPTYDGSSNIRERTGVMAL